MKKYIYAIAIIFIFVFIPKVNARELIFGANGSIRIYNGNTTYVNINSSANNLPKTIYGLVGSGSLNLGVIDLSLSPASGNINALDNSYNYLIFDTCLTGNISIVITNNGCTNSCVATGTYQSIKLSTSCTTGGNTGNRYLIQVPVQKWYLNEVAETLEAASFINISNNTGYAIPITINQVFLSDEDYTVAYANQEALINKLNSVQTAITNMQSGIINNNNTNTQNIINNQNANAAQAHTDAQNTQNKIDGVKDAVKDDTVNANTGKSFFDNFTDNTHGLSGIITAPLNIINQIVNVNPTNCQALSATYHNKTISLPCGAIFWGHTGFNQFNDFYNMVVGGFFCYLIVKDLFLTIEGLKDPDNDKVEVMDL